MPRFDEVARAVAGVPFMSPAQGRLGFEHIVHSGAGVRDRVTIVREFSSYTWWLKERIEERADAHGNVEPCFDFVYLDGAKNWTIDGFAVVLAEKLLRPGGWLLMDVLEWTYGADREVTDGIVHRTLSER